MNSAYKSSRSDPEMDLQRQWRQSWGNAFPQFLECGDEYLIILSYLQVFQKFLVDLKF